MTMFAVAKDATRHVGFGVVERTRGAKSVLFAEMSESMDVLNNVATVLEVLGKRTRDLEAQQRQILRHWQGQLRRKYRHVSYTHMIKYMISYVYDFYMCIYIFDILQGIQKAQLLQPEESQLWLNFQQRTWVFQV